MRFVGLLVALLLVGLAGHADACPPGPCNKYKFRNPPLPQPAEVMTYIRASRGAVPPRFDRRRLAHFLAASPWLPVELSGRGRAPATIRFIDTIHMRDRVAASNEQRVLIRRLQRRQGQTLVEINGVFYALERCPASDGQPTPCLIRSPIEAAADDLDLRGL